jgi:hypothetical protein
MRQWMHDDKGNVWGNSAAEANIPDRQPIQGREVSDPFVVSFEGYLVQNSFRSVPTSFSGTTFLQRRNISGWLRYTAYLAYASWNIAARP